MISPSPNFAPASVTSAIILARSRFSCPILAAGCLLLMNAGALAFPFSPPVNIWTGSPEQDVLCTGDVNSDALPDLAIRGSYTTLNWFVNTGGGNFTASHVLSVAGFNVTTAQVADLDGDGDADAILMLDETGNDYDNDSMAVFMNNGNGFTKTQQFALPAWNNYDDSPLVAADLDNDGDIDLAMALKTLDTGKLIITMNNGSGTLAAPVEIDSAAPEYPEGLVAGDFNNDGKTDLSVSHRQTCICANSKSAVYLYSGLGQGNFGSPLKLEVPFDTVGFASAGDLNRDGRTDLVFSSRGGDAVRWRANTGGSFAAAGNLGTAGFTGYPVAADLDEDGDPDVAWGQANSGTGRNVTWSRSNGAGQFEAPAELVDGSSLSAEVQMIQPMDVDLDGDTDLVMLSREALTVSLNRAIHRKVEPVFTTVNSAAVLSGEPRLASADFDRDGDEDLLVLSPDDGTLRWLPANGGALSAAITISTAVSGATAMATGDVTGDGLPDVVIGLPALGQLHVLRNVGNGATWQTQLMPNLANVRAVTVADVDVDGALDVLAFSQSTYRTVLFRNVNRNAASWTQEQVSATINAVDQIQAVQIKRPGRPELLLTSYDPEVGLCEVRRLSWANHTWSASLLAQGNGNSSVAAAADLNGDQTNDFVRSLGYGAAWQPNYNNGSFNPAIAIPGLPDGLRVGRFADLNGDGKPDLVAAGYGSVICAINNGVGSFAAPLTLFSAPGALFRDVVAFDFQRDGDLDLAVADAAGDQVRVLINRSGQFDTVSVRRNNGQNFMAGEEKSMISTSIEHLGAAGDDSLTLRNFRIQLHATNVLGGGSFSLGAPLTAAEASGLLEKVTVYRDLGTAGVFDAGVDPVVAAISDFSTVSNGFLTIPVTGAAAHITAAPGASMTFIFRPKLRTALNTALNAFNLTVVLEPGGTAVVHAGISPDLLLRDRGAAGTYSATSVVFKPTQLQQWRHSYWNTWNNTGAAANLADPDGDGIPNLVEFALGSAPNFRQDSPSLQVVPQGNAAYVVLRAPLHLDSKVKLTVRTSTDLKTWTVLSSRIGNGAWTGVQPVIQELGLQAEMIFPTSRPARLMARIEVEELP
jgi:hypothetical protein